LTATCHNSYEAFVIHKSLGISSSDQRLLASEEAEQWLKLRWT